MDGNDVAFIAYGDMGIYAGQDFTAPRVTNDVSTWIWLTQDLSTDNYATICTSIQSLIVDVMLLRYSRLDALHWLVVCCSPRIS
jgi:hypothetical protein